MATGDSRLSGDFCMIERRDYFIRCILEVPIHEVEEPFLWGVWITQSEQNFRDYMDSFRMTRRNVARSAISPTGYRGYPRYAEPCIPQVHWQAGNSRPNVELKPSTTRFIATGLKASAGIVPSNLPARVLHPGG